MEFQNQNHDLQELSLQEAAAISGGYYESAWYWVSYALGAFIHGATSNNISSGQRLCNAALG
jgi:hypothetical protein